MKKVLSLVIIMLIMLAALTGCVNLNYEVTLNKDGSADVAYVYGFDKKMLGQIGTTAEDMTSDMRKNAEENGYEIELYADEEIEGFKAKKHIKNISEISFEKVFGSDYVKDSEDNQIKINKKGFKTVYSQNAKLDLSPMGESMSSVAAMKYIIKLPTKVGENNADEVSKNGKTLIWNLKAGEINEINFKAYDLNNGILVVAIVAVAVIAIGVAFIVVKKLKKDKKEDLEATIEVVNKEEKQKVEDIVETENIKTENKDGEEKILKKATKPKTKKTDEKENKVKTSAKPKTNTNASSKTKTENKTKSKTNTAKPKVKKESKAKTQIKEDK